VCVCVCAWTRAVRVGSGCPLLTSTSGWPPRPLPVPRFSPRLRPRARPCHPAAWGRSRESRRVRAPRVPETCWAPASRGIARSSEVGRNPSSRARAWQNRSLREAGPVEGPRGAGRAARAPRCGLPDSTCCPGPPGGGARAKSRRPGNDAPQRAAASPRPGTPERTPWGNKEQPPRAVLSPGLEGFPGLGKRSCGLGCPQAWLPSIPWELQRTWGVTPSKMTLLAPWDPNYEATAGCRLVWGPSCGSGVSFSGRTLSHPSFWPLYQAASCRDLRPSLAGHQSEEQVPRVAGFPVMCSEDVFFLDPLLPRGQRVPLYLSEVPQQVMGSLKLLLPRPIMSPWLLPIPSSGCSTTWLSGPELIALTGLLQMSQGEPRPSSSGAPGLPSGPPAPASDHPAASGGPGCSHCGEPSLPGTPDAQGP
uniref:Uncharacterized protein n=1 Tax=Ovis aries TaxID=9940 RepID=A0AC11C0B9_SHEEP